VWEVAARQRVESLRDELDRFVAELEKAEAARDRLVIAKETVSQVLSEGCVPRRGVADHGPSPPLRSCPVRAAVGRRAITAGPSPASLNGAFDEDDSGRDLGIPSA